MAGISRRLAWTLTTAAVLASSCGASTDDADGTGTSPAAAQSGEEPGSADAWDDEHGAGLVTLRPVITCTPGARADGTADEVVLPQLDTDESCVIGPPAGTGDVFERGSAVAGLDETTGEWAVNVELRAAGAVVWNAVAQQCFNAGTTCPSRQLAIVLDDVIQAAPLLQTPDFPDSVRIVGGFTEDEARLLASALNRGPEPEPGEDAEESEAASDETASEDGAPAAVATTAPLATGAPTTAVDTGDGSPSGFLLPAMCGLPAAEWTSDEHPSTQERGTWATAVRIDGDITGDGAEEVVWATTCGAGTVAAGRGVHVFDDAHRPLGSLPVETAVAEAYPDRTAHPIEPRIVDGDVELEVWVWQSADATCCPSVTFDMSFTWNGDAFVPTTEIPDNETARPPEGEAPVVAWDGEYRAKTTPGRVVQLGHFGRQVELLQQALDQRGYAVGVDSYFGNGTEAAVRQFQRDRDLPVTGIATDDVWDALNE